MNLKKSEMHYKKKSLILDLDETLIHCVENPCAESDIKLTFKADETDVEVGINIRPYAKEIIRNLSKNFSNPKLSTNLYRITHLAEDACADFERKRKSFELL